MTVLLIILIVVLIIAVVQGFASNAEARQLAEYDVRELADELTDQERADEAAEEQEAREHLASKWSVYSD
jgi:predicted Holliday junction resolvase-like endonuclease